MSIQSEIDRIRSAKTDIIHALGIKGVDVESDATLSDIHTYIEQIQSGSGIGEKLMTIESKGGVLSSMISFGFKSYSGLVAASDDGYRITASGTRGISVATNTWYSAPMGSSPQPPMTGILTFKNTSGVITMDWAICPDMSISDKTYTIYGI